MSGRQFAGTRQSRWHEIAQQRTTRAADATPEWLSLRSEDDIDFNYGCDYRVAVENDEIRFVDDEVDDVDDMEYCCIYSFLDYDFSSTRPDYIILDSEDTRVKIDSDGYLLDDGERVNNERIINDDALDKKALSKYTAPGIWHAKAEWVQSVLDKQFPRDKKLRLARDTA